MSEVLCYIYIFHLTSLMSSHYLVKLKSAKFLHNNLLYNGCTEINFIEPGVKVNGAYYRDNFLAKMLLPDIFRKFQGWVLSFNRMVHWRIEHATPSLSWSERCLTSFLQHCGLRIHRI